MNVVAARHVFRCNANTIVALIQHLFRHHQRYVTNSSIGIDSYRTRTASTSNNKTNDSSTLSLSVLEHELLRAFSSSSSAKDFNKLLKSLVACSPQYELTDVAGIIKLLR